MTLECGELLLAETKVATVKARCSTPEFNAFMFSMKVAAIVENELRPRYN